MPEENKDWEQLFGETLREADSQKMPERIAVTRQAIAGRLWDLQHDSDHHTERRRINNALNSLRVLEAETRRPGVRERFKSG
jgi:hypothetical protein